MVFAILFFICLFIDYNERTRIVGEKMTSALLRLLPDRGILRHFYGYSSAFSPAEEREIGLYTLLG